MTLSLFSIFSNTCIILAQFVIEVFNQALNVNVVIMQTIFHNIEKLGRYYVGTITYNIIEIRLYDLSFIHIIFDAYLVNICVYIGNSDVCLVQHRIKFSPNPGMDNRVRPFCQVLVQL